MYGQSTTEAQSYQPGIRKNTPALASLRVAFKDALRRMLLMMPPEDAFNPHIRLPSVAPNSPEFGPVVWKVLVYDSVTRDILSTLFPVVELRDLCITVHMPLHSIREHIGDVPALYFVMPTKENVERISSDISSKLYDEFCLNFAESLPRSSLESLAESLILSESASLVSAVHDQYLAYSVVDENLFSLNPVVKPGTLLRLLNSPKTPDQEIASLVDRISSSLFGVCSTLGHVPILRFPRGNAAELVARKLDEKLRDFLMTTKHNNVKSKTKSILQPGLNNSISVGYSHQRVGSGDQSSTKIQSRAVLLILDRNIDYAPMLSHPWIYSALVQDVLDFKQNRITIKTEENGKMIQKTFDIDTTDFFWSKYSDKPYPDVAASVDTELKNYKQETQDLLSVTGANSIEEMSTLESTLNAKQLKTAITKLPSLTARKKIIDSHMQIATAILGEVKSRSLDEFYEVEQQKLGRQVVLDMLKNPDFDSTDKLRLLCLYNLSASPEVISGNSQSSNDGLAGTQSIEDSLQIAKAAEMNMDQVEPIMRHLREIKLAQSRTAVLSSTSAFGSTMGMSKADLRGRFTKFTGTLLSQGNIGSAYETIVGGVKQLLTRQTGGVLQKLGLVIDAPPGSANLSNSGANTALIGEDELLELDPLSSNNVLATTDTLPGSTIVANPVILFIVGGGNYSEYQNVMSFAKSKKRHVIYGATELLNASQFLEQIISIEKATPETN